MEVCGRENAPEKRKVGSSILPLTTTPEQPKRPDYDHGRGVPMVARSQLWSHLPPQK
jgi:hypothetical protein